MMTTPRHLALSGIFSFVSVAACSAPPSAPDSDTKQQVELLTADDPCFVPGDVDLDGDRDSADLVIVYQAGRYETDTYAGYYDGDFDHDFAFASSDLVLAMQDGGNYRDSGCGYGLPPYLNATTWAALLEAVENEDEQGIAANLEVLDDVAAYVRASLSPEAYGVIELVLQRAEEEAYSPLEVMTDIDSLIGDLPAELRAQVEAELGTAFARLPGATPVMASTAGVIEKVGGVIWNLISFGAGIKICRQRADRLHLECLADNVRGDELDADEAREVAGCCRRKREGQGQDCSYGVEISYSDYAPCADLADELRAN